MKHYFPGIAFFIGEYLLKLIYGPGYRRRWYSDSHSGVHLAEGVLTVCTVLWVVILVMLLTSIVPLHAAIYLLAYPSALFLRSMIVRRKYKD